MTATETSICIIPARGGSKRIPRKNIRPFRGRPMLEWSIDAARSSGAFNTVMVSTDDPEIAECARRAGADVPFLRSHDTSDDYATTADVLAEVLLRYAEEGEKFRLGCCLYPTAPFVRSADICAGRKLMTDSEFDVVMPVAPFTYPIGRSLSLNIDGRIELNFPENLNVRSQDLPPAFHDAGQWYWFYVDAFMRERVLMGRNTGAMVLPATHVQDIDSEDDWTLAELKHERIFG